MSGAAPDWSPAAWDGRVAFYRLAKGFLDPLREHCLRLLVEFTRTTTDAGPPSLQGLN